MISPKENLPDFDEINNLEKIANKNGSGIIYNDLLGIWRLKYIWRKGSNKIDNVSSSFLQILFASLDLSGVISEDETQNYVIKNSITFGFLSMIFCGKAYLTGKRPVLRFYFEKLLIKFGNQNIKEISINKVDEKKMPFFLLIKVDDDSKWLSARGKGGGLALWVKSQN